MRSLHFLQWALLLSGTISISGIDEQPTHFDQSVKVTSRSEDPESPHERELNKKKKEDPCGCPGGESTLNFPDFHYRVNGYDTVAVYTELYARDWVASINDALQGKTQESTGLDPETLRRWGDNLILEGVEFDFLSSWGYYGTSSDKAIEMHCSPSAYDASTHAKVFNQSFWHLGRSFEYFRQLFKKIHMVLTGKLPDVARNPSAPQFPDAANRKNKRENADLWEFMFAVKRDKIESILLKIFSDESFGPDFLLLNGPYQAITKTTTNLFKDDKYTAESVKNFLNFWLTKVGPDYSDEKLNQFRDEVIWDTCKPVDPKFADDKDKTKCKWFKKKVC